MRRQAELWFKGKLPDSVPVKQSLSLWGVAAAMEWSHLPVAGGIYDQHPALLDEWSIIWSEKSAHDQREEAKRKRKGKK